MSNDKHVTLLIEKLLGINNVFKSALTYKHINSINNVRIRNIKNGITLPLAFLYRFMYSKKDKSFDNITSFLNHRFDVDFKRQSYSSKEGNISSKVYDDILTGIINLSIDMSNKHNTKLVAVDGTYNINHKYNEQLNVGYFDTTNNIFHKIDCNLRKNNEPLSVQKFIEKNVDLFRDKILVFDRAYHSKSFYNFLNDNDLSFIIRIKNNAVIKNLTKFRVIKMSFQSTKSLIAPKSKHKNGELLVASLEKCMVLTNIKSSITDDKILEYYHLRWNIEVKFKLLKQNFKFAVQKEHNNDCIKKNIMCDLILMNIVHLISYIASEKYNTQIINGIYDHLIYDIINGELSTEKILKFIKKYIVIKKNAKERTFPRVSKLPFSKWYVKGYSIYTQFKKILEALKDEKTCKKLNKNDKVRIKKIIDIIYKK